MNEVYYHLKRINFTNCGFYRTVAGHMLAAEQQILNTIEIQPHRDLMPTGAEMLIEALAFEGVDTIFGYPGGAVLHIYDELWRARDRITHYLVRHEQGAVHMAEGYARSTGRVGVVLVTSGPGATNAVTGIANAYMDSTPIVVITGQVPKHLIGTDAFQEVDTVGITRPCVKHNYLVREAGDLPAVIRQRGTRELFTFGPRQLSFCFAKLACSSTSCATRDRRDSQLEAAGAVCRRRHCEFWR
jgi:thiamine pyrophosphate-dependent enzyme